MWLVVGLGNPGRSYASHRHNVGFMVVDGLAARVGAESFRDKFSAELARAGDMTLLKPQTFMNLSGQSVQPAAAFLKVPVGKIVVIHDELDVPFGEVRIKVGGGHAGHNGLRSLILQLGSPEFVRVRVGIGRPSGEFKGEIADWVLSGFDAEEKQKLGEVLTQSEDSVLDVLARGVTAAMNRRNTKATGPKKKAEKPSSSSDDRSQNRVQESVLGASPRSGDASEPGPQSERKRTT